MRIPPARRPATSAAWPRSWPAWPSERRLCRPLRAARRRPLQPCTSDTREGYSHYMSRFRAPSPGATDRAPDGYLARDFRGTWLPSKGGERDRRDRHRLRRPQRREGPPRSIASSTACPPARPPTDVSQGQSEGREELPPADGGWALEGSMDLDMVSAACPTCKVLLVDPTTTTTTTSPRPPGRRGVSTPRSSRTATAAAVRRDGPSGRLRATRARSRSPPAVTGFTAASSPRFFRTVLAVGGTSPTKASNARGWDGDVWAGAGSRLLGIRPGGWVQKDAHCQMRTVADVSAVADPETGVAIYDGYENPFGIPPGWIVGGGTSASAPLVAGMIGLAGNGATYHRNTPTPISSGRRSSTSSAAATAPAAATTCTGTKGYERYGHRHLTASPASSSAPRRESPARTGTLPLRAGLSVAHPVSFDTAGRPCEGSPDTPSSSPTVGRVRGYQGVARHLDGTRSRRHLGARLDVVCRRPLDPAPSPAPAIRRSPSLSAGTAALRVAITDASGSTLTETMRGALLPRPDRRPATGEVRSAARRAPPRKARR